jgi:hypothetical protein
MFVVFVIAGGLLTLKWRWIVYLHLPAAAWGTVVELFGWTCPLTPWENGLRRAAGDAMYSGSFVEHYLLPILYPAGLSREIQVLLGLLVILVNLVVYGRLVALNRLARRRQRP